jgi:hypothetical protein
MIQTVERRDRITPNFLRAERTAVGRTNDGWTHDARQVKANDAVLERESSHPQTRIRIVGTERNPRASIFLLAVCAIARGDLHFFCAALSAKKAGNP